VPVDIPRTDSLVWNVYRYAGLLEADTLDLDPTNRNIATNLSFPFYSLWQAYLVRGDQERSMANFQRARHLSPGYSQMAPALSQPRDPPTTPLDTGG
jgi:hypothetical protein